MKRIIFVVVITVLALVGFTFFTTHSVAKSQDREEEHEEEVDYADIPLTEKQVSAVDLRMDEVSKRSMDQVVEATGVLYLPAQNKGEVSSLMGGVVKNIYVKEGQTVSKGQIVASVENTDVMSLQREYYSIYKECEFAKAEMERQKTLSQSGAGVKKTLQQSTKDYQVAHASLTGIGRQLQQIGISTSAVAQGKFVTTFPLRTPISGVVSQIMSSLGSFADMQTPVMSIRDNQAVECNLNVFEKDLSKVKPGNRVCLSLTNQSGVSLSGEVYGMNQYFTDGTKSVAVHVRLHPTKGVKLFDGMYVTGKIATSAQLCQTLPSKAIVKTDGKQYIFALNGSPRKGKYSFSRHEVSTGVTDGRYTEVQLCKHIKEGQKIVTDNAFYLASLTGDHGEEE